MKLILASNSPRRKEFLANSGFTFTAISSPFDEVNFTDNPFDLTKNFALGKAKSVFDNLSDKTDAVVLGADTVVCFDGKILGKPKDSEDAIKTLKALSNKTHLVISGYAIVCKNETIVDTDVSQVIFNELSDELIERYVASGLPLDKAGSYGVQDGYNLVKEIKGSYNNVVGLPTEKVIPLLHKILGE